MKSFSEFRRKSLREKVGDLMYMNTGSLGSGTRVSTIKGLINPSKSELISFVDGTRYNSARFILIKDKNRLLVWDSYSAIHSDIIIPEMGWEPTDDTDAVADFFTRGGNVFGYFEMQADEIAVGISKDKRWNSSVKTLKSNKATYHIVDDSTNIEPADEAGEIGYRR